nr:spermidine synthase [Clostridium sp.]
MDLWFTEEHSKNARFSIKVNKQVFTKESKFQRIDILESDEFGRFLTLDGFMMLTEKDEFIYHEMITHTAMAVNLNIKNVLVIGGGDGGAIRELCKYDFISNIDLVEIDEEVVK